MTKPERLFWDFVQKHILLLVCAACAFLAFVWRASMWEARTQDYTYFFSYWVAQLRSEGLAMTLRQPLSNYPPAYNVVLWLFTLLPVTGLTAVKLMATLFDYANLGLLVLLAQALCPPHRRKAAMTAIFCLGCLLPVPMLNSAYWGQCDAIYTTFLLAALLCLVHRREPAAVMLCAVGLCFKMQALFFLPLLLVVYCTGRRFSALWFLTLPGAVVLSGLPTVLAGGSLFAGVSVYLDLTDLFGALTLNYPNFYSLAQGGEYELLKTGGIVAAFVVLGTMLAWVLYRRCRLQGASLVLFSVWCTLACTLFLPAMHERYAFYAELVVWLYFIAVRDWRGLWLPALLQTVTLVTYANYFWGYQGVPGWVLTLANYVAFALLTRRVCTVLHPQARSGAANGARNEAGIRAQGTSPQARVRTEHPEHPEHKKETLWL